MSRGGFDSARTVLETVVLPIDSLSSLVPFQVGHVLVKLFLLVKIF